MSRYKNALVSSAGLLALAAGFGVRHWMQGTYADFASGFLVGISIALLILGLARPSKSTFR